MVFTVRIHTNNAAFDDLELEIARILREIASDIEHGKLTARAYAVRDANGNTVGTYELKRR